MSGEIRIALFGGVAPRVHPRLLDTHQAQTALNCDLQDGSLRPWLEPLSVVTPSKVGTKLSIYRFGQDVTNEAQYWFHSLADVDWAKGPVPADTSERTYYTGETEPRVTDSSIALAAGTDYPMAWYKLGVPAPAATPGVALGGVGSGTAVDRTYVYTYVSGWGEEGLPSAPSAIVSVKPGNSVTVSSMSTGPGTGYNITAKRIYRAVTGANSVDFRFVAEIAVATTSYADSIADSSLGESLPSAEWDPPPTGMLGIIALPNQMMAGFYGADVYLCEPSVPSAWPIRYRQPLGWKIVGLGTFGSNLVACTKGKPYIGTGVHPSAFTFDKIDVGQACVSKTSIAGVKGVGVVYASPAGLALVGPNGSTNATESVFTRKQWQALMPSSMRGYDYNGRYFGFYDTGSVQGGFILDPSDKRAGLTFTDQYATAGYNDPIRDTLYLQIGAAIKKWNEGAAFLTSTWKSKVFVPTRPSNPGFAQVEAETYPLTFKLYVDGSLKATRTVASKLAFRLPDGYRGREFEVEVSGTKAVKAVYMAETMDGLKTL